MMKQHVGLMHIAYVIKARTLRREATGGALGRLSGAGDAALTEFFKAAACSAKDYDIKDTHQLNRGHYNVQ